MTTITIERADGCGVGTMAFRGRVVVVTAVTDCMVLHALASASSLLSAAMGAAEDDWPVAVTNNLRRHCVRCRDALLGVMTDGGVRSLSVDGRPITPAGLAASDEADLVARFAADAVSRKVA